MAGVKWNSKISKFRSMAERKVDLADLEVKPNQSIRYINSGSTVINMLIGGTRLEDGNFVCPGWPRGKIIEIFGRESSGKSTVAMMAMGQALLEPNGAGLYVDLEHAVMDTYARKLGVDFLAGNATRVAPHTAEETEAVVNSAALAGVDLIVVDSVAAMVSKREVMRDVTNEKEKVGIAELPRIMSNWMPKLQDIISRTRSCVIFLNQTRDKIGAMGYSEEAKKSTPGGNALKFYASNRILLTPKRSAKAKVYNPLIKGYEEVTIATDVLVKNVKNKIDARQHHTGLVTLRYGVGIDEMRTMLNIAEAYKIVQLTKKNKQITYTFKSSVTGEEVSVAGVEKFRLALSQKPEVFAELQNLCIERVLQGYKMISDEALAELASDAVYTKEGADDDDDDDMPDPSIVDPEEMGVEDDGREAPQPTIDAGDL